MDKLDYKIMEKLMDNSRLSFRKIAKELGVSTDTAMRRYKKLKKNGTLKPTIAIDLSKFGYQVVIWYMISLMPQINSSSAVDEIAKIPNVTTIIKAVGDYDLLAMAMVKDFQHMYKIGDDLAKVSGVTKIEGRPYIMASGDPEVGKACARGFYRP